VIQLKYSAAYWMERAEKAELRISLLESSLKEAEQERDRRGRLLADALVEIERLTELQPVSSAPEACQTPTTGSRQE
jgi:hypothetical protein